MTGTYIATDGTSLAFRILGEGDKDVLLIHGWMTSSVVYEGMATRMVEAGYRVILPDLRGVGASSESQTDYSLATYTSDMVCLLTHLGVERCAIVGHSMGGQIAQLLSLEAPEKVEAQVLLCPVPASGLPLPDDALGLFQSAPGNAEALATILSIATVNLSDDDKAVLVDTAVPISSACLLGGLAAWTAGGFSDRLSATQARTLVVASEDPFLPRDFLQQAVADLIPNARLTDVAGAGHYVQVEQCAEATQQVLSFLSLGG
ncbi:MAG: alpha/beta fold hydrolase [Myxococcota bacterium]